MPHLTRRRLLALAGVAPLALVVGPVAGWLRAATGVLRPPSAGTTATRCAACGATDHTMLDPACPASPRVRPEVRA